MDTCDVLIVGGGPAGSTCAWKLARAGLDVLVIDKARFPRDKVCAGWITPEVVEDLQLDLRDYRQGRTLQSITGFRTGVIGGPREVEIAYQRPVSYGIRRCEFDYYLLRRSGARLQLGTGVSSIRRGNGHWIVDEQVKAPVLVGAGGHFCPIARMLNSTEAPDDTPLVVAQEAEFEAESEDLFTIRRETPELYFCADLRGYGWCFRKQGYLNVGLGRVDRHRYREGLRAFVTHLKAQRKIPSDATWRWRGHAYLLSEPRCRQVLDDGVLLAGDAAGLAYPQSGEGIGPAIRSGGVAAATIVEANGIYSSERLAPYEGQLRALFPYRSSTSTRSTAKPARLASKVGVGLLRVPWFVRHVVLDRWFLHAS